MVKMNQNKNTKPLMIFNPEPEHIDKICQLRAEFKSHTDIKKQMEDEHNLFLSGDILSTMLEEKQHIVKQLRDRYLFDLSDLVSTRKRERITIAETLLKDCKCIVTPRVRIETTLKVLAYVKDEIEGNGSKLMQNVHNVFNTQINQNMGITDEALITKIKKLKIQVVNDAKKTIRVQRITDIVKSEVKNGK